MNRSVLTGVLLIGWLTVRIAQQPASNVLALTLCDVGQGDAVLISLHRKYILIDGGRDSSVMHCLSKVMPFWHRNIDLVVATHPDADHISGLTSILENYRVNTLLTNGQSKQSADFEAFKRAAQAQTLTGMSLLYAKKGMTISLEPHFKLKVLSPLVEEGSESLSNAANSEPHLSDVDESKSVRTPDYNDGSIVLLLSYLDVDVLLMGDLEAKGEQALIKHGLIGDVDVLKVGHHGSKTSTSAPFLLKTRPEISLVSAGKNNQYGHPSPQVIRKLEEIHSVVLRTDKLGTIKMRTDGQTIWFDTSVHE